jgi:hypothetical protein
MVFDTMNPSYLYRLHLDSHYRKNLHCNAVELVKTAPGSCLRQSLVNVATGL